MLFLQRLLIAITLFSPISVLASSSPQSIQGKPLPDRWHQINLTEPLDAEITTISARDSAVNLEERTPMNVCQAIIVTQACLGILDHVVDYSRALGAAIKSLSDQHSCRYMTGTFDNVKWSFHATGQHCDTTAQEKTIAGAIAKYIRNAEHGKICGTQCLRLNHGGTWDGWLKLGSVSSFNEHAYCGTGLPFAKCISGGNNDI